MSILNTAPQAVQTAAVSARGSIIDLGVQALKFVNGLRRDEYQFVGTALDRIGLQRRESSLRPIAWIAAGAVVGGAAVLLLAPASGKELRRRVGNYFGAGQSAATDAEAKTAETPDVVGADARPQKTEPAKTTEASGTFDSKHELNQAS